LNLHTKISSVGAQLPSGQIRSGGTIAASSVFHEP